MGEFDGWLVMAIAAGGAALAATNHLLGALGHFLGFTKASEERRRSEVDDRALRIARQEAEQLRREIEAATEASASAIRQHVAAIQRGVEGKQAVMEQRIADFYREMRDRDEQIAQNLYDKIGQDIRASEERLGRQIEQLAKHVSEVYNAGARGQRR